MAPPVFKTGLAANTVAGGFDSLPPPPLRPELTMPASIYLAYTFLRVTRTYEFVSFAYRESVPLFSGGSRSRACYSGFLVAAP